AVLSRMNAFGRIALCGIIAGYNGQPIPIQNVRSLLVNRLLLQGFIVAEHMELWPQALVELAHHVAAKRIRYRETVAQRLTSAPRAFIGLLKGEKVGKQLVNLVGPSSTSGPGRNLRLSASFGPDRARGLPPIATGRNDSREAVSLSWA